MVGKMPLYCFQYFIGDSDIHNSLVHKNTLCFLGNTGDLNMPQCYVIHALPVLFNSNVQYILHHNITAVIRMPFNRIRNSGDWFAQQPTAIQSIRIVTVYSASMNQLVNKSASHSLFRLLLSLH